MALLKKKTGKRSASRMARLTTSGGGSGSEISPLRPQYVEKLPPCTGHCPSGNDIRGWLGVIAQRDKLGLTLEEACDRAWEIEVATNPFPAVMGRVCPHPCENECNRTAKDGAVAINSVERFIGDWGLERKLPLPRLDTGGPHREKVAVVGAGPSGLSVAYQLARRGYGVTIFEALPKPGGMLRYGIPEYRLPRAVLDAEITRILDLGVDLQCGTAVGDGTTLDDIRSRFAAVYLAIGAHKGRTIGIPGEDGPGVYTGTDFLRRVNAGEQVALGDAVVIIGGGDTAVDAARVSKRLTADAAAVSRRMGARTTILYRRTRAEMPAIDREIDEAMEEDIAIEFLAAPIKILRGPDGAVTGLIVQRMELGEPDESGRRRPIPIDGDTFEVACSSVIMAVSQQPDWESLGTHLSVESSWLETDEWGRTGIENIWAGGDARGLGLATISIGQGRRAAESIHASLRGLELPPTDARPPIGPDRIVLDFYEAKPPAQRSVLTPEERLRHPFEEADRGLTPEQAIEEANRCFSCGLCFNCESCWMYCQNSCFKKAANPRPGFYYTINLATCDGCKKCWEVCPCGYIDGE